MSETLRKAFFVLATQIPLLSGLYIKWGQILQRPIVTTILALLYELIVIGVSFWRKVWAELEPSAIKATADWVRAAAQNFNPGFRRNYNRQIIREYGIFNVRGLGLINTYTLKLEQVFVDLRIVPSANPQRGRSGIIETNNTQINQPIWNFLRVKRPTTAPPTSLAIIGPPGCGKTTLLQHVALTLAGNRQRKHRLKAYTPLLLFLRDHVSAISDKPEIKLGTLAQDYIRKQFQSLSPPTGWVEKELARGCIVLLDGLDEVADVRTREAMSRWVDKQTRSYPQSLFVVTSRPQGYAAAPLDCAHVIEVQPLTHEQVCSFVNNWYTANEILASGNIDDADVRYRAKKDANDLLRRLKILPAVSALTVNPLLLTMIAMVHRYHGALPGSRVELYNEICEVLLGRWRQARGVRDALTGAQKRAVLQPLAAEMMKNKVREIRTEEALKTITPILEAAGFDAKQIAVTLPEFQAHSGLLLEREVGLWSFAHLTFQEFLTASHWLEDKATFLQHSVHLRELIKDPWWHETLRLYATKGEASDIVRACLEVDTVPALTLAVDCTEEALRLNSKVREAVQARLIEGLEAKDPNLRDLAAKVQLTRRLKQLQRIDDHREIDLTHLTCAEYQLFLNHMRAGGVYCQPDHWREYTFSPGHSRLPIGGVRYKDAMEFCSWLNKQYGGEGHYRLPTPAEAIQWQSQDQALVSWCSEQGNIQLIPNIGQDYLETLVGFSNRRLPLPQPNTFLFDRRLDSNYKNGIYSAILAIACGLPDSLSKDIVVDLSRSSDLDNSSALHSIKHIAFTRANEIFNIHAHAQIAASIDKLDIQKAYAELDTLQKEADARKTRSGKLLQCLLKIIQTDDPMDLKERYRNYIECVLECIYEGGDTATKISFKSRAAYARIIAQVRQWRCKIFSPGQPYDFFEKYAVAGALPSRPQAMPEKKDEANSDSKPDLSFNSEIKVTVLEEFWRLQLLMARESGRLPALEGIRVVREQTRLKSKHMNLLDHAELEELWGKDAVPELQGLLADHHKLLKIMSEEELVYRSSIYRMLIIKLKTLLLRFFRPD